MRQSHPVNLINSACFNSDDYPKCDIKNTQIGICCVTGQETETLPRKKLFGKSFTDGSKLIAPGSDRVGIDTYRALKYKWERMSSWICDGRKFKRLDRVGVRDAVFGSVPVEPWTAYATTSYKKHGSLRSVINNGSNRIWLFESRLVDCSNMPRVMDIWDRLNIEIRSGFSRPILETVDCQPHAIKKIGIKKWMDFESWAIPIHKSALYSFMCYLLPSQKELKDELKNNDEGSLFT